MSDYLRDLFQLGQATHQPAFVPKNVLGWIADQGRLAVVCLTPEYCPHTDATLPTPARRLVTTVDDLDAGHQALADLYNADENSCSDDWYEIWDRNGRVVQPEAQTAMAESLADCPFWAESFVDCPF